MKIGAGRGKGPLHSPGSWRGRTATPLPEFSRFAAAKAPFRSCRGPRYPVHVGQVDPGVFPGRRADGRGGDLFGHAKGQARRGSRIRPYRAPPPFALVGQPLDERPGLKRGERSTSLFRSSLRKGGELCHSRRANSRSVLGLAPSSPPASRAATSRERRFGHLPLPLGDRAPHRRPSGERRRSRSRRLDAGEGRGSRTDAGRSRRRRGSPG